MSVASLSTNRHVAWVAAFTALSWLGEYVHNLVDLPQLTLLSPENSIVALVAALLFAAWRLLPAKRLTTILLLAWGGLHLVGGGILSIIPFPFLPYYPAQTLLHYAMHAVYSHAQLPLIWTMIGHLRKGG